MLVFFYDKTFEGLLTAVFEAYSRKTFPDNLLGEGSVAPSFMGVSDRKTKDQTIEVKVWSFYLFF